MQNRCCCYKCDAPARIAHKYPAEGGQVVKHYCGNHAEWLHLNRQFTAGRVVDLFTTGFGVVFVRDLDPTKPLTGFAPSQPEAPVVRQKKEKPPLVWPFEIPKKPPPQGQFKCAYCERFSRTRGLCDPHYQLARALGILEQVAAKPRPKGGVTDRDREIESLRVQLAQARQLACRQADAIAGLESRLTRHLGRTDAPPDAPRIASGADPNGGPTHPPTPHIRR